MARDLILRIRETFQNLMNDYNFLLRFLGKRKLKEYGIWAWSRTHCPNRPLSGQSVSVLGDELWYKCQPKFCKSRATRYHPKARLDKPYPRPRFWCFFSFPRQISTFMRFPRFSRLATRKRKQLLRSLSNRRLRGSFMKPFALFLWIFACSFCVFWALFSGNLRFFSVSFSSRPPFEALGTQMRWCYKFWHLSLILSTVHKT